MCTHKIKGKNKISQIVIGKYPELAKNIHFSDDAIFITDNNLAVIYNDFLKNKNTIVIQSGEENKNLTTMDYIYDKMIEMGADRKSFVIGFGGGMVTDIAGFAASTYMRGIDFGFIPTSLLAMVDASIGGKNGVNHHRFKNMIGNFNQPSFVMIDATFLKTLPVVEYINGMAEAIKHLLISDDKGFFNFSANIDYYINIDKSDLSSFLCNQIKIKIDIVNRDEKESGERKKLNFGHTFGHAIEKLSGIKHGFAVSTGMMIAAKISQKMGLLTDKDVKLIKKTLTQTGLPVTTNINSDAIISTIYKDKKKSGEDIDFIALEAIGKAQIIKMKIKELEKLYKK